MFNMTYEKSVAAIRGSFVEAIAAFLIISFAFLALEPVVGRAATDEFTVTQTVSDALTFQVIAGDVSMVGDLDGITGGTSHGTTSVVVRTNNADGYNMTIKFSSTTAMIRNGTSLSEIYNYKYSTGTASYPTGFDITPANAQFGFTALASTTSDVSSVFTGAAGTACGTGEGTTFTAYDCWRGASETNEATATEIINRGSQTPGSGATTTLVFRLTIPGTPTPTVPNGTYVATATLTATEN